MEDTAMKKRAYKKPSMRVVELQHRTCLLPTKYPTTTTGWNNLNANMMK